MGMPEPSLLTVEDRTRPLPAWEGPRPIALWATTKPPGRGRAELGSAVFERAPVADGETTPRVGEGDGSIEIGGDEIHVWCVQLDVPCGSLTTMAETLGPGERDRAERFRFESDWGRYVAAHGALRRILSAYVGLPPGQIRYTSGACGRPRLAPDINPHKLDFNLSHSGELAMVAVAGDGRVGVDLEMMRDLPLEHELAERSLSAGESSEWWHYPAEARTKAFLYGWTRKEACLKADGRGLRRDPRQVPVGFGTAKGQRWSHVMPDGSEQPGWAVCSLELIPGFVASVAVAD
jgi:4'-phosphopantetheinyl transferase